MRRRRRGRLLPHVRRSRKPPPPRSDKPVSFINDVAPILKENCFACHDAKKKSGKYEMTTYEKIMAGGANGEPIARGQAEGERVPRR